MAGEGYLVAEEAATVVLTRGGSRNIEVFLVKRHRRSGFMAGAYVFPGGKLDPADLDMKDEVMHPNVATLASRLQATPGRPMPPPTQIGLVVAACRELFEEAGVLLATSAAEPADEGEQRHWGQLIKNREAVAGGHESFEELLRKESLQLNAQNLGYWAHWITPSAEKRRFDTRFFVAKLPSGQSPSADGREITETRWMTPVAALQAQRDGSIFLPPPTLRTLEDISLFQTQKDLFAFANKQTPFAIMPKISKAGTDTSIVLPWDREYATLEGEGLGFSATDHRFVTSPSRIVFDGSGWLSIDNRA